MIHSILDSDLYKFTMQNAVMKLYPRAEVKYSFFNRGKTYIPKEVADDLSDAIWDMEQLFLTEYEEDFLREKCYFFDPVYIDFLKGYTYDANEVKIWWNDGKLSIDIEGYWYRTILWEVPIMALMSELYFKHTGETKDSWNIIDERTQWKAARFDDVGVKLADFGTRRRYSYKSQDHLVKEFKDWPFFVGTSNVHFAHKYNLKSIGTQAHEWMCAHSALMGIRHANKYSMENWIKIYNGDLGIVLPDTFGTTIFLNDFDTKYAKLFDGVRHDSGNPILFAKRIINHYEKLRIDPMSKTIVFSDNLNFEKVINIHNFCNGKIKDSYGIGTNLTNDVGVTPLNIVIKLVEINNIPVVKLSDDFSKAVGNKEHIKYTKKLLEDSQYYVYVILDPRKCGNYLYENMFFEYEPFYVGKGRGNRSENHLKDYLKINKKNNPKNNKIKKILSLNQKPIIIKLVESLSELEAFEMEKYLIKSIGRWKEGPLVNLTSGGEGTSGRIVSDYIKEKISLSLKGKFKGRKLTEEWKEKISKNNARYWKGKSNPSSDKARKKISNSLKGKTKTKYKMTSPEGEEFIVDGIMDFCKKYNLNHSHLIAVAKGRKKQHKGWKCEYLSKPQR